MENCFHLTDSEKLALKQELSQLEYDPNGFCQYINDLRFIAMRTLPKRILTCLVKQKASIQPFPYIFIDNLPTDDEVYKSPKTDDNLPLQAFKSGSISENLLLAISSIIGEPYSISFEGSEVVNNLVTSKSTMKDYTGLGASVELDFHIENAALKSIPGGSYSPQGLLLTGVSYDKDGPQTFVSDGRKALQSLPAKYQRVLLQPRYSMKVPFRWRNILSSKEVIENIPLVRGSIEYPDIAVAFYSDMVKGLDLEATYALKRFYEEIKKHAVGFRIQPGQLLYIDNHFTLHSREVFQPNFDSEGRSKRWVQRTFIAPNLWNHREMIRNRHRVFQPRVG